MKKKRKKKRNNPVMVVFGRHPERVPLVFGVIWSGVQPNEMAHKKKANFLPLDDIIKK